MKPWTLRVDWTWKEVRVEHLVWDEEPRILRKFDNDYDAIEWAKEFLDFRGFDFRCAWGDKQITLQPIAREEVEV